MAIKRSSSNPVIVLDVVVTTVERDTFTDRKTGAVSDKGRRLGVQTGAGPSSDLLEVRVPVAFDQVPFDGGEHVLINVEYSEYNFADETGRERVGSIMRFHSHVNPSQLDQWSGVVKAQGKAVQTA